MMTLTDRLFARSQPLRTAYAYRLLGILVSLIAVFCVWTSWATLEEQIRATGTVIVSSRSQVVQAVDGGVLRKLHVRE
jgi:membrane fusion protein, adhesin transport system